MYVLWQQEQEQGPPGCVFTYGTAVEFPTGRVHTHVVALPPAALRHGTSRFHEAWSFGPPYSFRLALLRDINRADLSVKASPLVWEIHARELVEILKNQHSSKPAIKMTNRLTFANFQQTSRSLSEHTRLDGGVHGEPFVN